jgi:hypothetical protein
MQKEDWRVQKLVSSYLWIITIILTRLMRFRLLTEPLVIGYPRANHKKFRYKEDAYAWLRILGVDVDPTQEAVDNSKSLPPLYFDHY